MKGGVYRMLTHNLPKVLSERPYIHVLSVLKSVCKVTKQYLYNQIITEKIRKKNAVRKYLNGRQLPLLSPGQTAREYRD